MKKSSARPKVVARFLYFREMLTWKIDVFCGFSNELTATSVKGKLLEYADKLYSKEHKQKFIAGHITARITTR